MYIRATDRKFCLNSIRKSYILSLRMWLIITENFLNLTFMKKWHLSTVIHWAFRLICANIKFQCRMNMLIKIKRKISSMNHWLFSLNMLFLRSHLTSNKLKKCAQKWDLHHFRKNLNLI